MLSEEQKKERFKRTMRRKREELENKKFGVDSSEKSNSPQLVEEAKIYMNMPPQQFSKPHLLRKPKLIPLQPRNYVGN